VLILDEPLNGLDPEGIRWMRGLLRSLAAEGRTVLVSSHLLTEVAQTVDEIIVLANGRLVTETTLAELAGRSSVTRARTTDAARLADVLLAARIQVRLVDGTTVEARGTDADAIGLAAAGAGLPILELSRHDEDLESLFFELVNAKREVAA
jgi:ABC-2 type transport system ATP-binding protein